jgi:hypothetical protein
MIQIDLNKMIYNNLKHVGFELPQLCEFGIRNVDLGIEVLIPDSSLIILN